MPTIFVPKSKSGGFFKNWFKDWKPLAVIAVFLWSLYTLIQFAPDGTIKEWQYLAQLSPADLQVEVNKRVSQLPGYDKMSAYEKEDLTKQQLDDAQLANNIQVLGHYKNWVIYTNLKLGLDLRGGSQLLLLAKPAPPLVPQITPEVMSGVETVINNRINSLGVSETLVQRTGKDRLIVEMPGIKDPQQAKDRIGTTALLEFKELDIGPDGKPEWKDVGLTGAEFKHAQAAPIAAGGQWRVSFEFKPDGAKKFGELTSRLVGRQIGIFLDGQPTERGPDGRALPANEYRGVTVREPILGGSGEITGNFTKDQAVDLAVKLNAGALPVPVTILEERTVGATLGQDSIQKSLIAGAVGITLVMLFMILIYGLPGLIADIALVLYTIATLAVFKAMPVTLTLAGIAGFILSVGMAVDANILIFERTKEELKNGKTLYVAIENGFNRAFTSIFDSNVNSLIACAVLMLFGTSIVKGFAVTLAIGVALSMFTAITATRALLHLVPKQLGLFGHTFTNRKEKKDTSKAIVTKNQIIDIVKYRSFWFGISAAILIPGIIGIVMCCSKFHAPLKPGIDFTGGSILQYQFDRSPTPDSVLAVLKQCGFEGSQVQQAYISGKEVVVMRTKAIDNEVEKHNLDNALEKQFGQFKEISVDKVSGTIGPELLTSGLLALVITFGMMVAYISFRFKFDYAVCAIVALFHDVLALCGIFAILGLVKGMEVDSLFISAILTVIGFSVHDTIVVFDRIRENAKYVGSKATDESGREYRKTFGDVANDSVNQTLARSIYTSLTVIITLTSLYFLGGITTRDFVLAMLIGIISGTYSSIFNASCLLVLWREIKNQHKAKLA